MRSPRSHACQELQIHLVHQELFGRAAELPEQFRADRHSSAGWIRDLLLMHHIRGWFAVAPSPSRVPFLDAHVKPLRQPRGSKKPAPSQRTPSLGVLRSGDEHDVLGAAWDEASEEVSDPDRKAVSVARYGPPVAGIFSGGDRCAAWEERLG